MRSRVEWVARFALLVTLALMTWRSFNVAASHATEFASSRDLHRSLPTWTRSSPTELDLDLQSTPDAAERSWLGAIAAAGTNIIWRGTSENALAASSEPLTQPGERQRLNVA